MFGGAIRFVRDDSVKDHTGEVAQQYREGDVVTDLSPGSAAFWVMRGSAVYHGGRPRKRSKRPKKTNGGDP